MSETDLAPGTVIDLTNCEREPIHLLGAVQPREGMRNSWQHAAHTERVHWSHWVWVR